jgi:hypothetical protein
MLIMSEYRLEEPVSGPKFERRRLRFEAVSDTVDRLKGDTRNSTGADLVLLRATWEKPRCITRRKDIVGDSFYRVNRHRIRAKTARQHPRNTQSSVQQSRCTKTRDRGEVRICIAKEDKRRWQTAAQRVFSVGLEPPALDRSTALFVGWWLR